LITGSGRCGTLSLAVYLDGLQTLDGRSIRASHETEFDAICSALTERRTEDLLTTIRDLPNDIDVDPLLCLVLKEIRVQSGRRYVVVVRDGRASVRSGYNKTWYMNQGVGIPWLAELRSLSTMAPKRRRPTACVAAT